MQGFNMGRYVPPEHEGQTTGNRLHGKKPPGFHGGKQTVRFEMPFNVFCLTCEGHITQGVRFNAEKAKIGKYFSTPIFSFRMRHTVCSGWIEVQTDPKNTAYLVTEGAKRTTADEESPGVGVIKVAADPSAEDPFAQKEKNVTDKTAAQQRAARIAELKELSDRQWKDPYEHSRKMRKVFRDERKVLQSKAAATEAIRDRAGLSIELLDELPEDAQRAALVEYGTDIVGKAESAPLFTQPKPNRAPSTSAMRDKLQDDLRRNTRILLDPFLNDGRERPDLGLRNLKRKVSPNNASTDPRSQGEPTAEDQEKAEASIERPAVSLGLEGYDSDD